MEASRIREYLVRYNTPRRIVQFLSFVLFSAMLFGLSALPLVLPVLWTWRYQPNTVGDAFTAIQLMLGGWNLAAVVFPWVGFASFLLVGVLIGKSMCGWVCPFGFVQDMVDVVKRRKRDFSLRTHDNMVLVKYVVLGAALFVSMSYSIAKVMGFNASYDRAFGVFAIAPFTALSPAEALFGVLPVKVSEFSANIATRQFLDVLGGIALLPPLFWAQFVIMWAILVFVAFVPRGWCRYFCPHGAIMAFMNNFSFIGLRRDPVKCAKGGCRLCVNVCPMRVPILDLPWEKFSHEECIYCMKCVDACKDKAIRLTYP